PIRAGLLGEEHDELKAPLQQGIDDFHRSGMAFRIHVASRYASSAPIVDISIKSGISLHIRSRNARGAANLSGVPGVRIFHPGTKGPLAASHLRRPVTSRPDPRLPTGGNDESRARSPTVYPT